jgi:hypothetical protein
MCSRSGTCPSHGCKSRTQGSPHPWRAADRMSATLHRRIPALAPSQGQFPSSHRAMAMMPMIWITNGTDSNDAISRI